MLNISTRDLAIDLADRLNDIMPQGFVVHVQGAALAVMHSERIVGVSDALAIMESVEAIMHPRENLETAVRAALSGVQDHIAETTTEPWPGSGGTQPNPDARVAGDRVQLWFGSEEDPLVTLRPIDLA
ncbi:hypothetical protein [Pseudonocardia sp. DLS-67]